MNNQFIRQYSNQYLLDIISDFYKQHNRAPKTKELKHSALILKRFGSLNEALDILGIKPNQRRDGTQSDTKHICKNCSIEFVGRRLMSNNKCGFVFCSLYCSGKYTFKPIPEEFLQKVTPIEEIMERNWNDLSWEFKRRRVIHEQNNCCNNCGLSTWTSDKIDNKNITLQVHHINHNALQHDRDNLEALCANCHSLTESYLSTKISPYPQVTDEEYKEALKTTPNINQALNKLGLPARGNSYARAKRLLAEIETEKLLV